MAQNNNDLCLLTNEYGITQYYCDQTGAMYVRARHGSLIVYVPLRCTTHDGNTYYGIDIGCKRCFPSAEIVERLTMVRATNTVRVNI